MKMNRSWWQLQGIETCFYTEDMHRAFLGSCHDGLSWPQPLAKGIELSSSKVQAAEAPYHQPANEIKYMAEKRGINALAVRPDLRLVAAARWDRRVELFDGKTLRCRVVSCGLVQGPLVTLHTKTAKSLNRLVCHDDAVLSVAFEREKGSFATGGADGRIAIWSLFCESYLGPIQSQGEENLEPGDLPGAKIGKQLGHGAASQVFACRRLRDGEKFAVKTVDLRRLCLLGDMQEQLSRLDCEVRILKELRHETCP
eukprot:g33173.t1